MQQIISAANLEKGSRGTCEGLKGIFEALLAFISSQCCPFLEDVRESFGIEYPLSDVIFCTIENNITSLHTSYYYHSHFTHCGLVNNNNI